MNRNTADKEALLEKVLRSFEAYYNIDRETPTEPFDAEASFGMHDEQYFLMKSARISQSDSSEYVFFRLLDHLDPQAFRELDRKAWETTLSRVDLSGNHKSTDACLVIIADTVDPEAAEEVRKTDHYKSYRLGLKGWSTCRMIVYECQTGRSCCNRRGEDLSKLFQA
jgi:hypothetical protein